jgi:hypothetical protein
MLRAILQSLTRIAYNGDPLQLFVTETTYQPFISLLHMLEAAQEDPSLAGLRMSSCSSLFHPLTMVPVANFASALAIELRRGDEGDSADYLRFQFKNGTADSTFRPVRIFGHSGDIALTEFIYRTEVRFSLRATNIRANARRRTIRSPATASGRACATRAASRLPRLCRSGRPRRMRRPLARSHSRCSPGSS